MSESFQVSRPLTNSIYQIKNSDEKKLKKRRKDFKAKGGYVGCPPPLTPIVQCPSLIYTRTRNIHLPLTVSAILAKGSDIWQKSTFLYKNNDSIS